MFDINFSEHAKKDLDKLPKDIQKRIVKKLQFFSSQLNPIILSKPLVNLPPATHRFRVGDYRIAFYISGKIIYIERIKHRRDVYLS